MTVTNKTQLNMVIGYPLIHSQSPVLHAAVYQRLGINAVLLAKPHPELKSLIQAIKIFSVQLTAVTVPHKEKVMQYIDYLSPEVRELKAANTLIQRDGKLYGYNTDIVGIAFALRDIAVKNKRVLVLGAGGAARAMGYFLKRKKAQILWLNRTPKKAKQLAKEFGGEVIAYAKLSEKHIDIIINTTPVGMYPDVDTAPLSNYTFSAHQVVFDMVYHPVMTALLKQAKKQRAKIISGLDMFIGQGLKQIELLAGKRIQAPLLIDELRNLLIKNQRVLRT